MQHLNKLLEDILKSPLSRKGLSPAVFHAWPHIMGKWASDCAPLKIFKDRHRDGNCLLIKAAPHAVVFLQAISADIVQQCAMHLPGFNIVNVKFVNEMR